MIPAREIKVRINKINNNMGLLRGVKNFSDPVDRGHCHAAVGIQGDVRGEWSDGRTDKWMYRGVSVWAGDTLKESL